MNSGAQPESAQPVAVMTLRTAKVGYEEKFEAALHAFISESLQTEGQLGVHVVRPAPKSGSREYGIVRRFSNPAFRDAFYDSKQFREWEQTVAQLTEGVPARQELSGLEAWFTPPGHGAVTPPRWKMAVVTVLGVWPVSMVVPWLLHPLIAGFHLSFKALIIALGIVILLTWAVMPVLVRIFDPWLKPRP